MLRGLINYASGCFQILENDLELGLCW